MKNQNDDDSDYGAEDEEEEEKTCDWTVIGTPKVRERSSWKKVDGGICRVMNLPARPYPSTVTTWKQMKQWRLDNPDAWRSYRSNVKAAVMNAEIYTPYNKEECDKLKGRKSNWARVEKKWTYTSEEKYCPRSYPKEEEEEKEEDEGEDEGEGEDEEKKDDDNKDDEKKDDEKKDDDKKVDYGSGEVPDPVRESL
mgnify:CR=1 FL=1|jgi:hypothetical protein